MWVLKIKVSTEGQFMGSLAVKHQVSIASYTFSYYKDKKWLYLNTAGFIFGKEKNKKSFVRDLRKQSWMVNYEIKNDFGIAVMKQPLAAEAVWDSRIIQLAPILINWKEKKHTWHMGSFNRSVLEKMLKYAQGHLQEVEVLRFKQEKITNISMVKVLPELSKQQKKALEIAINNGYYSYPKKVYISKLAEIMKVSPSTYQEHLSRAEEKVLPQIYSEL